MKALTVLLADRGDLPLTGTCRIRYSPGRFYAFFHPTAPPGMSICGVCDRLVLRGLGRWWVR